MQLPYKKKILLMDDEVAIQGVISSVLAHEGYDVTCAKNGEEAIEFYREGKDNGSPFDAVILDLVVPKGMGGRETIGKLREIDPDVRAIVSSGYSDEPVMAAYRDYGFLGILPKPYRIQRLLFEVTRVISPPGSLGKTHENEYIFEDLTQRSATI